MENNIKRKEKNSSDKFSTMWVNGVKFKLEDINTPYLIKQMNLLTVVTIGGLLGGLIFLISPIVSLIKNDISIYTLLPSMIATPLVLLALFINTKRIKFIKNELKKRKISDEEKALINKNLKRTVIAYITIGIAIVGSLLIFTGILLDSTDIDSNSYGKGGYEMPNENDDSAADYIQRVDPELYSEIEENYNEAVKDYGNSDSNKNSNGFVGSDGKYHNYVPEFGDDVNNWMAENW